MIKNGNFLLVIGALLLFAIFGTIFMFDNATQEDPLIIGFMLSGSAHDSGWNGKHYAAMKSVADKMGAKLLVRENIQENTGECPKVIQELAKAGAGLIYLTSYGYPKEAVYYTEEYPRIAFCTTSAEIITRNMTANFVRLYQGRYLSGIIAGLRTQSNLIGYVAAMGNSEVNRGINAFALGVQRVNPEAKVLVAFTGQWEDAETEKVNARRLIAVGADVLTYHQNQHAVADVAEENGVDFIGYHEALSGYSPHYLTSVVCRWEAYYTDIVHRYLKGELNREPVHWVGIEKDAVYLTDYSSNVTEYMRKNVERAQRDLEDGFMIFSGEIYDNQGNLRCGRGESLSDDILLEHVNWLAKGVEVLE